MKILIIEDDPSMREVLQSFLKKERYVVEAVETFGDAMEKVSLYEYECILLDIMLPDGNGLAILEELKKLRKQENVIIISAKDSVDDKVAGLELGADDYLTKPFHLAELSARIKSLIRRNLHQGETFVELGNVKLFPDTYEIFVNKKPLELNRKEYDILNYFMARPNRLIEKNNLAEAVWGDHIDQVDNFDFIYVQMRNLRKKLNDAKSTLEIKAVYKFGYKMILKKS